MKIWQCKIGEIELSKIPEIRNSPMRQAVDRAYQQLTGESPKFLFSDWKGQLSANQWQIVEDAKPVIIELWIEGYRLNGDRSKAQFLGNFEGPTLRDAVIHYKQSLELKHINTAYPWDVINTDKLTDWGCRFFNNEADAREAFG